MEMHQVNQLSTDMEVMFQVICSTSKVMRGGEGLCIDKWGDKCEEVCLIIGVLASPTKV